MSHKVTRLTNGTEHRFEVRAKNAAGAGASSAEARATPLAAPAAPTGFKAAGRDGAVKLAWTTAAAEAAIRHEVRWRDDAAFDTEAWTAVPDSAAGDADADGGYTHKVTGLTNGTLHTFEVRAVNAAVAGDAATATATPANNPPTVADTETGTRTISEGSPAHTPVGEALAVTDADGDTLTWSLSDNEAGRSRSRPRAGSRWARRRCSTTSRERRRTR